jgi:hypothetical protein
MGRILGNAYMAVQAHEDDDKRHADDGITNDLSGEEVDAILAIYKQFGASSRMLVGIANSLGTEDYLKSLYGMAPFSAPRYRVFDWLTQMIATDSDKLRESGAETGTKVMVHAFLSAGGDVDRFIQNLRASDYESDRSWEAVDLEA